MTPNPPEILRCDISQVPKLDRFQAGHLRHFHNTATQIDGEWRHMGALEPGQEFLDAYRYQLATMTYAAGAAHYHRLPAMRSLFKPLIESLIHKMLRRDVWGYWFNTSLSGNRTDPGRTELRQPWSDPIIKENIMYSGHLLLMTSLYAMLFDDDKYEQPGALTFNWDPLFFRLQARGICIRQQEHAGSHSCRDGAKWVGWGLLRAKCCVRRLQPISGKSPRSSASRPGRLHMPNG